MTQTRLIWTACFTSSTQKVLRSFVIGTSAAKCQQYFQLDTTTSIKSTTADTRTLFGCLKITSVSSLLSMAAPNDAGVRRGDSRKARKPTLLLTDSYNDCVQVLSLQTGAHNWSLSGPLFTCLIWFEECYTAARAEQKSNIWHCGFLLREISSVGDYVNSAAAGSGGCE